MKVVVDSGYGWGGVTFGLKIPKKKLFVCGVTLVWIFRAGFRHLLPFKLSTFAAVCPRGSDG